MIRTMLIIVLVFVVSSVDAQKYTTAIGGRFGNGIGLTLQQKLWDKTTAEVIFAEQLKTKEQNLSILLEHHNKLIGKRLNFYLGAGPQFGWLPNEEGTVTNTLGVSGIAGLEMTIGKLNLSWDFKPTVNVSGGNKSFNGQTAISLRYVFIKHKKKKVNWKFWEKKEGSKKKKKNKKKR